MINELFYYVDRRWSTCTWWSNKNDKHAKHWNQETMLRYRQRILWNEIYLENHRHHLCQDQHLPSKSSNENNTSRLKRKFGWSISHRHAVLLTNDTPDPSTDHRCRLKDSFTYNTSVHDFGQLHFSVAVLGQPFLDRQ